MKKLLLIAGLLLFTTLSCSKETINEDSQLKSNETFGIDESINGKIPFELCPTGYHSVISWEFDSFKFKRPKFDCNRGFWFCSDCHWEVGCQPNQNKVAEISNINIENGIRTVAIALYEGEDYIDFYFPQELITVGDFTTFNVDDELNLIEGVTLKKGDYPSRIEGDEIIITVDIK